MKMSPFDRSCTSSYWRSIVTMALSCVISEMNRDIGHTRMALKYNLNLIVENRDFLCPPALDAPLGSSSRNIAVAFGTEKIEWWGCQKVIKFEDIRFDTIHECDRRTDKMF